MSPRGLDAALDSLGGVDVFRHATAVMSLAHIAERRIKAAIAAHPDHAAQLAAVFRLLVPLGFAGKCDDLYAAHCDELLERVVAGEDTRPGTKAEVLIGIMGASLMSPLRSDGQHLAERLFREVMGKVPGVTVDHLSGAREPYAGAFDEALAAARKACRRDDRRMPKRKPRFISSLRRIFSSPCCFRRKR